MTVTSDIQTRLAEVARWERRPGELYAEVDASEIDAATVRLQSIPGARLANVAALDERPLEGGFRVLFTFSLPGAVFATLGARLSADAPAYPTVSVGVHAADWYERQNADLFGIIPAGHPLAENMVLHYDWPGDLYPLRKDFPREGPWPPRIREPEPPPRAVGPGIFQYTLGPVRSGVTESARFLISSFGEEIADVATRFFYNHRGLEKRCEDIPLEFVALWANRIAANSAVAHSTALASAVESIVGVEMPERVQWTRLLLAEMERVYNHTNDLAHQAEATGLAVGFMQGTILSEELRRLNGRVSGHRYLFRSVEPGAALSLDAAQMQDIAGYLRAFRPRFRSWTDALLDSHSHVDRLEQTGIVPSDVAADHALVGPVARGSGQAVDMRRDHPYGAYRSVTFPVPMIDEGDALARNRIRIAEVFSSLDLIDEALERMPEGPSRVAIPPLPPYVEAQGWSEGPRGSIVHRILSDGAGRLYRYAIRPASFVNWHAFHLAATGPNILTDFPIIERSFALVIASNDR